MRGSVIGAERSGQTIMVALVLMVGSFYTGSLFGTNQPIYVSHPSSHSGPFSLTLTLSLSLFFFGKRITLFFLLQKFFLHAVGFL